MSCLFFSGIGCFCPFFRLFERSLLAEPDRDRIISPVFSIDKEWRDEQFDTISIQQLKYFETFLQFGLRYPSEQLIDELEFGNTFGEAPR